ncbi:carboxypeptidase-like regulatory domain-containing protein [Marinilabiliaceae bacterium ANBcel2]|nr:carboxypeptidase-like regulatory domain-containing protein [Marinilabiliaceae bacterium ANBcel2]
MKKIWYYLRGCYIPWLKRTLLIMKLTAFLLFAIVLSSTATNSLAQVSTVTLEKANATLAEIFDEIEKQTNYVMFYNKDVIDDERSVSVNVEEEELVVVLNELFGSADISYEVVDDSIVLSSANSAADFVQESPDGVIRGQVTDQHGDPVPGVSILVQGTNMGTISDLDGNYVINNVYPGHRLLFTFLGMKDVEVMVTEDETTIDVVMQDEAEGLDEIVIVGYGTQQRTSVVGSISSVEPEKLEVGSSRSLSNRLAGQLAGVIGVQRSGEPGHDDSHFWIRGISTFAADRSPLVLVDGVERSLNNIDPAEVESISVLKDASASAVYGVRGANGVVLINTKRGQIGEPTINVRYEQSFTQPVKLPDFLGAGDYLDLLNQIAAEEGRSVHLIINLV